jgi:hypothetical protein
MTGEEIKTKIMNANRNKKSFFTMLPPENKKRGSSSPSSLL